MANAFSIRARNDHAARAARLASLGTLLSLLPTLALGCSAQLERAELDEGEVGVAVAALSVCDETVPTNRFIDGIPAYAQCGASMTTAIYSDDGINTATTQMGPDWVRTQYSGGYQCTELAHRYLYFRWDIDWTPRGNAGEWCATPPPANIGVVQTMVPVHGDVMVLAPGSCGASASTGHATVVDVVNGDSLSVVEQNGARRGTYKTTCAKCFLHVVANDGTPASIPDPPAGTPTAGAAAPPPTTPPVMMPPAQPPATTPPPTVPPAGTPMAGSAAPAPATPVPAAAPPPAVPPPVAAPVGAPPPAMPVFVPPPREQAATESGCTIPRVPGGTTGRGTTFALLAIALFGLALRRRKRLPASRAM